MYKVTMKLKDRFVMNIFMFILYDVLYVEMPGGRNMMKLCK